QNTTYFVRAYATTSLGTAYGNELSFLTIKEVTNRPPIAKAGPDQEIMLPNNTVTLDGSGSTDPENNILQYQWTKLSGPASFSFSNPNVVQTTVTLLTEGYYLFVLKVTDAGGLFSKDTVQVNVKKAIDCYPNRSELPVMLLPSGTLSVARMHMAVASAGNKIVFAGGETNAGVSSTVDILDLGSNTWSTAQLSEARTKISAVVLGKKIFFGGGQTGQDKYSGRVDIYDTETNAWTVTDLILHYPTTLSGAAAGNKVVFYGYIGIHIYDATTNNWSTISDPDYKDIDPNFSDNLFGVTATSIGNMLYFAGGAGEYGNSSITTSYSRIRIFNTNDGTWTYSSLNKAKGYAAGIAVGNNNYWAGGYTGSYYTPLSPVTLSEQVEIRNVITNESSSTCLFQPNAKFSAVQKNGNIVFFTGVGQQKNKFDIYSITGKSWSVGVMDKSMEGNAIISVNNIIYVAGGKVKGVLSNQMYKMEF
ncbi:MAG: kelch repeat-containing protein, partial [Ferruginibacter sp.]